MKKQKFYPVKSRKAGAKQFNKVNPEGNRRFSFRAFTVIELLVVISIIGLLSSIILVATKGAREKARIVSILQFSSSVKHAIGDRIVGEWKFEGNLEDTSGNGNDGTWVGGEDDHWVNNDISQLGKALYFDTSDSVVIPYSVSFDEIDKNNAVTVELWLNADILNYYSFFNQYIGTGCSGYSYDFGYQVGEGHNAIYFSICGDKECESSYNPEIAYSDETPIKVNKWYHIVGTYDGSEIKIFIDGKQSGDSELFAGGVAPGVWQCFQIAENFKGYIDEIRVYSQGLTSAQIKKHYVEGAIKRELLTKE